MEIMFQNWSQEQPLGEIFFFKEPQSTTVILFQVSSHHCVHLQCNVCMLPLVWERKFRSLKTHKHFFFGEGAVCLQWKRRREFTEKF